MNVHSPNRITFHYKMNPNGCCLKMADFKVSALKWFYIQASTQTQLCLIKYQPVLNNRAQ